VVFVDFVDLVVLLVVVAGFDFAAVLVACDVADFDPDVLLPLVLAVPDFDLSAAIVPPAPAVPDLATGTAPGVPHLTNFPEASRHWPPLAAAGHLTNLPEASRHWLAASAAPARLAARLNAARKLSDLRMVVLQGCTEAAPLSPVNLKLRRIVPDDRSCASDRRFAGLPKRRDSQ
jgi:hypothetical protein